MFGGFTLVDISLLEGWLIGGGGGGGGWERRGNDVKAEGRANGSRVWAVLQQFEVNGVFVFNSS